MAEGEVVHEVEEAAPATPETSGGAMERFYQMVGIIIFVGLLVASVFAALEIWPDKIVEPSDPSWLDNIFASKTVLFGARVVLFSAALTALFGAVFTVGSIVVRMRSQHWLRRVGPFEVSEEAVSSLRDQVETLRELAGAAEDEITQLRAQLQETEELAEHFYDLWQEQLEEGANERTE